MKPPALTPHNADCDRMRFFGTRLGYIRTNPRGGHEHAPDAHACEHPVEAARAVLFTVHGRNLAGVVPPVAVWTKEHQVALDILLATEINL